MRLTLVSLLLIVPVRALAAPVTIAAGATYSLDSGDLVLNGADTLDANTVAASANSPAKTFVFIIPLPFELKLCPPDFTA